VRVPLCSLFHQSAWAQPASVLDGTTGKVAALASVSSVGVGSTATAVAGTTGDGSALAPVCLVGMGSTSHCGGRHDS
jgi:hypothetical protein